MRTWGIIIQSLLHAYNYSVESQLCTHTDCCSSHATCCLCPHSAVGVPWQTYPHSKRDRIDTPVGPEKLCLCSPILPQWIQLRWRLVTGIRDEKKYFITGWTLSGHFKCWPATNEWWRYSQTSQLSHGLETFVFLVSCLSCLLISVRCTAKAHTCRSKKQLLLIQLVCTWQMLFVYSCDFSIRAIAIVLYREVVL